MIGFMGGLSLFRLELTLFGAMDGPCLVHWAQKVSLSVYFLGVGLSIFWFLLLPLFSPFSIFGLFASWFLTLALAFYFSFAFPGGDVLNILDILRLPSLSLSTMEARAVIFSCSGDMEFHLLSLPRISNLFKAEVINSSDEIF